MPNSTFLTAYWLSSLSMRPPLFGHHPWGIPTRSPLPAWSFIGLVALAEWLLTLGAPKGAQHRIPSPHGATKLSWVATITLDSHFVLLL